MEANNLPSIKSIFHNEQKYNSINLYEAPLYEHALIAYHELINHPKQEDFTGQLELLLQFFNIYNKFDKYDFCKAHLNTGFQIDLEDDQQLLIKDAILTELLSAFYDKLNLIVTDFMEVVEYVPHRVSFNNKTSVFLIAYATELKELWEAFDESKIMSIIEMDLENKIYREEYFKDKLKFVAIAGTKGAWAKGPINLVKN